MERVDLLLLRLAGLRTALIVPTHVGASSGTLHTNAPADKGIDQKLIFFGVLPIHFFHDK